MRLKDKKAIVTGAGGGIGRAICIDFAKEGAAMICLDIDKTLRLMNNLILNNSSEDFECFDFYWMLAADYDFIWEKYYDN